MPKGFVAKSYKAGKMYWFHCPCEYRWAGNTLAAQRLAFRLHSSKCEVAKKNIHQSLDDSSIRHTETEYDERFDCAVNVMDRHIIMDRHIT